MNRVTCIAPVNIAVIKYWGKRNETLILPLNDSISTTLCTRDLCSKTTVMASPDFTCDRIWLNGREESIDNPRLQNCLSEIRRRAKEGDQKIPSSWRVHICSENNFPTASGLASSASGYACLVFSLAELYGVKGEISSLARMGSGSACRSIYGGFVRWHKGAEENGTDSLASQIAAASHWPELRILILVVSDRKKEISSKSGMQSSVKSSTLLTHRVEHVLPERVTRMEQAIMGKDFAQFGEITMKDSNQFHAVCLDSFPPIVYMKDISHAIVNLIQKYNSLHEKLKVAYTFDAGPNACLYMLQDSVPEVVGLIDWAFPSQGQRNTIKGLQVERIMPKEDLTSQLNIQPQDNALQYMILTKLGDGPKKLEDNSVHLLDMYGLPAMQ